jgi:hypothetical protein
MNTVGYLVVCHNPRVTDSAVGNPVVPVGAVSEVHRREP